MKIIINLGREILLLGSVRESIMKPSETSSGKKNVLIVLPIYTVLLDHPVELHNRKRLRFYEKKGVTKIVDL
jgi:hypothetical protein